MIERRYKPEREQEQDHARPSKADLAVTTGRAARIAGAVIRQASRSSPADQCLRAELKKSRGLDPATSRLAARMVFASYRWRQWLDLNSPPESQAREALKIQARFNQDASSFPDSALIEKAIPSWAHKVMEVSAPWVRAIQSEPVLWLRARPGEAERLIQSLGQASAGPVPDSIKYDGAEDLFTRREFQAGEFEIQDIASQIVGQLCAPQQGETWWDACAGEGGKTLHLSALMQNKGLIWASDRAAWRLTRLKQRAARAQVFNYRTAPWSSDDRLPTKTSFDGVLMDAPCSVVGTWQRNPQARWTTTAEDVAELATLQGRLLRAAAPSVKPGGRLIYAVCTLARAETTDVADAFGAHQPEFVPEPFGNSLAKSEARVWLWPQEWHGNGMFIAQWRKRRS